MSGLPRQVNETIADQDGVISRSQALATGLTIAAIRTRLEEGDWSVIQPGVYLSAQHVRSAATDVRAASLWAGASAVVSGAAAAWWWDLTDLLPTVVEVTTPRTGHRRSRTEVSVVRRPLDRVDTTTHRGIRVTSLALSALFGAVALGQAGPAMLDRALQRRVQLSQLQEAHQRNLGRHGSRAAGDLLIAAADGAAAISERLMVRLLHDAEIIGWRVNYPIMVGGATIRPDFVFLREGIVLEVDGWAWHHAPDRFQRDRARQNALISAGWTVLRFTWLDLTRDPAGVIEQVQAALWRRRASVLS
jgi:very-short-patch-repair endonuclease